MKRFNGPGFLFLIVLAVLWQAFARHAASPNFPGFLQVIAALMQDRATVAIEMGHTLVRAGIGFLIALLIMLPLGILLGRVRVLGDLVEPVIEFIRPLPPIAVVPVAMIFFGTGDTAKIFVVVWSASFPILINAMEAVQGAHPMLSNVARSLRLSRAETMWHIDLPAALPQIMAGVRLAVAISILIAVVAEMLLSTNGIGMYLAQAQERFEIANGLAGLLVIALVALAINYAVLAIERKALRWHHQRLRLHARA